MTKPLTIKTLKKHLQPFLDMMAQELKKGPAQYYGGSGVALSAHTNKAYKERLYSVISILYQILNHDPLEPQLGNALQYLEQIRANPLLRRHPDDKIATLAEHMIALEWGPQIDSQKDFDDVALKTAISFHQVLRGLLTTTEIDEDSHKTWVQFKKYENDLRPLLEKISQTTQDRIKLAKAEKIFGPIIYKAKEGRFGDDLFTAHKNEVKKLGEELKGLKQKIDQKFPDSIMNGDSDVQETISQITALYGKYQSLDKDRFNSIKGKLIAECKKALAAESKTTNNDYAITAEDVADLVNQLITKGDSGSQKDLTTGMEKLKEMHAQCAALEYLKRAKAAAQVDLKQPSSANLDRLYQNFSVLQNIYEKSQPTIPAGPTNHSGLAALIMNFLPEKIFNPRNPLDIANSTIIVGASFGLMAGFTWLAAIGIYNAYRSSPTPTTTPKPFQESKIFTTSEIPPDLKPEEKRAGPNFLAMLPGSDTTQVEHINKYLHKLAAENKSFQLEIGDEKKSTRNQMADAIAKVYQSLPATDLRNNPNVFFEKYPLMSSKDCRQLANLFDTANSFDDKKVNEVKKYLTDLKAKKIKAEKEFDEHDKKYGVTHNLPKRNKLEEEKNKYERLYNHYIPRPRTNPAPVKIDNYLLIGVLLSF